MLAWGGFWLVRKRVNVNNGRWKCILRINSSKRFKKVMWLCAMGRQNLTNQQTISFHSIWNVTLSAKVAKLRQDVILNQIDRSSLYGVIISFVFPTTRWQTCSTSILDQNYVLFLFKVFEEIAEKVSDRVIDAEAVQFTASRVNCEICERKSPNG